MSMKSFNFNDDSKPEPKNENFLLFFSLVLVLLGVFIIRDKINYDQILPRNTKIFGIVSKLYKNSKNDNMYEVSFLHLNDTLKIHNRKIPTKRKFVLNQKVEVVYNTKQAELARLNFPEELEEPIDDPMTWILFAASCIGFLYFLALKIKEQND
jgi:hypothetical protein